MVHDRQQAIGEMQRERREKERERWERERERERERQRSEVRTRRERHSQQRSRPASAQGLSPGGASNVAGGIVNDGDMDMTYEVSNTD